MRNRLIKLAQDSGLFEKLGSRLRAGIKVVQEALEHGSPGFVAGEDSALWHILHNDKHIGVVNTLNGKIGGAVVDPAYRGMGVAQKAYGEIARDMPGGLLRSDSVNSEGSFKLWSNMSTNPTWNVRPRTPQMYRENGIWRNPSQQGNFVGQMPRKALRQGAVTPTAPLDPLHGGYAGEPLKADVVNEKLIPANGPRQPAFDGLSESNKAIGVQFNKYKKMLSLTPEQRGLVGVTPDGWGFIGKQ